MERKRKTEERPLPMFDALEIMRRRLDELHSQPRSRKELESVYRQVWDETELLADFDVLRFLDDSVEVRRKSDGQIGSLSFQDAPRLYFVFISDLGL